MKIINDHSGLKADLKEIDLPYTYSSAYQRSLDWDKRKAEAAKLKPHEIDLFIQEKVLR